MKVSNQTRELSSFYSFEGSEGLKKVSFQSSDQFLSFRSFTSFL